MAGGFPDKRSVTWKLDVLFNVILNNILKIAVELPMMWDAIAVTVLWRQCNDGMTFILFDLSLSYTHICSHIEITSICIRENAMEGPM